MAAASRGQAGQEAAVRPPRGLPSNKEFLRLITTRFMSRSLTLLSMGTAPSEANTVSSCHWPERSSRPRRHGMFG